MVQLVVFLEPMFQVVKMMAHFLRLNFTGQLAIPGVLMFGLAIPSVPFLLEEYQHNVPVSTSRDYMYSNNVMLPSACNDSASGRSYPVGESFPSSDGCNTW